MKEEQSNVNTCLNKQVRFKRRSRHLKPFRTKRRRNKLRQKLSNEINPEPNTTMDVEPIETNNKTEGKYGMKNEAYPCDYY